MHILEVCVFHIFRPQKYGYEFFQFLYACIPTWTAYAAAFLRKWQGKTIVFFLEVFVRSAPPFPTLLITPAVTSEGLTQQSKGT